MAKTKRVKVGGRAKGTMNRKSEALFDLCEAAGYNPFAELLRLSIETLDDSIRMGALKELCQYLYPKRKAIEHSMDQEQPLRVVVEDYGSKK